MQCEKQPDGLSRLRRGAVLEMRPWRGALRRAVPYVVAFALGAAAASGYFWWRVSRIERAVKPSHAPWTWEER